MNKNIEVGDRVRWNGAAYYCSPRYYTGTVIEVEAGLAFVKDDEWGGRSGVRVDMLEKIEDDNPPWNGRYRE